MPVRRTYGHHLAAFCCHNSPFTPFKCGTFPDWFSVRDVPSEETVWNSVTTNRRIVAPFLPRGKGRTGDIDTAVELRTETCSIRHGKMNIEKSCSGYFSEVHLSHNSYQRVSFDNHHQLASKKRKIHSDTQTQFNIQTCSNYVNLVVAMCSPGFLGTTKTSQNLEAARGSQGRSMFILCQAHMWRAMPQVRDSCIGTNSLDVFTWWLMSGERKNNR